MTSTQAFRSEWRAQVDSLPNLAEERKKLEAQRAALAAQYEADYAALGEKYKAEFGAIDKRLGEVANAVMAANVAKGELERTSPPDLVERVTLLRRDLASMQSRRGSVRALVNQLEHKLAPRPEPVEVYRDPATQRQSSAELTRDQSRLRGAKASLVELNERIAEFEEEIRRLEALQLTP